MRCSPKKIYANLLYVHIKKSIVINYRVGILKTEQKIFPFFVSFNFFSQNQKKVKQKTVNTIKQNCILYIYLFSRQKKHAIAQAI